MPASMLTAPALIVLGALALTAGLFMGRRIRLQFERRLGLVAKAALEPSDPAPSAWRKDQGGKLSAHIKTFFTFGRGFSWGMHASARKLALAALTPAAIIWLLSTAGLGLPVWFAVPACAAGALLGPRIVLHREQERAKRHFNYLFPDAVDMVARLLRAGLPMTFAIQAVGKEAPAPVNKVFSMVAGQIEIGIPVAEALDTASQQVALPDFRFFAVSAIMQYATGGNLIATLDDLSAIMRKRHAARLKARAASAEVRFSAYVLLALPVLVVAAMLVVDPEYLDPLFYDRRGHLLLAGAAGNLFLAFVTMRHMTRSISRE
jgi:tight adherence protein B